MRSMRSCSATNCPFWAGDEQAACIRAEFIARSFYRDQLPPSISAFCFGLFDRARAKMRKAGRGQKCRFPSDLIVFDLLYTMPMTEMDTAQTEWYPERKEQSTCA